MPRLKYIFQFQLQFQTRENKGNDQETSCNFRGSILYPDRILGGIRGRNRFYHAKRQEISPRILPDHKEFFQSNFIE